jgi:hypothetical protein
MSVAAASLRNPPILRSCASGKEWAYPLSAITLMTEILIEGCAKDKI